MAFWTHMLAGKDPILVTGATGFVGSHVARALVKSGKNVHLLVRKNSDTFRIADILSKVSLHTGSLSEKNQIAEIVNKVKPVGVFHLAAETILPGVPAVADRVIESNFLGTIHLLESLEHINYNFFIQSGSFIEYKPLPRPMREDDLCEPAEVYGLTKLAATLYGKMIANVKNKPIVSFRFFTPYGPYIQKSKLIEQVITNALFGKNILLTSPTIARDFIYIDDLIELLISAAPSVGKYRGEIFNAGSGTKTSIQELVEIVLSKTNSKSKVVWQKEKVNIYDSDHWQADLTKTSAAFSWKPRITLDEGLGKTIEFFRNNPVP